MTKPPDLPEARDYRPSLIFTFGLTMAMLFLVENPADARLNWFGLEFRQHSLWVALLIAEAYLALMAFGEKQLFQSGFWALLKIEWSLGWPNHKRALIRTIREFVLVPVSVMCVFSITIYKVSFAELA